MEDIQTGVTQEAAALTDSQPLEPAEQVHQVPLAALESERSKRQQYEEENRLMREHLALLQRQSQVQQAPRDDFGGLQDSDVMTVGDFKKMATGMARQMESSIEELKMQQKNPDYSSVVTKYLPGVLKENPRIAEHLKQTQDYELAYYLAKNSDEYKSEHKRAQRSAEAERIVKNAEHSSTLSGVGNTVPVAGTKTYKSMSDSEFRELMSRNLGY
ncbi:MAG TPA: hypothetical protein PL000_07260 [Anaerolineales bacterium]|nr:hypothetical protein [Anaerolineales bacterium]